MRIASLVVLVVAVLLSGSSTALADDARLGLSRNGVTWTPSSAGDVNQVDVRVRFRGGSTNQSQRLPFDMSFHVMLRESDPGNPYPVPTPTDGNGTTVPVVAAPDQAGGLLPDTGAPVFWTAFVAIAMLIAGFIVAPWRRDQEVEISHA